METKPLNNLICLGYKKQFYTISITALLRCKKYPLFSNVLLHLIDNNTNNLKVKQLIEIQNF